LGGLRKKTLLGKSPRSVRNHPYMSVQKGGVKGEKEQAGGGFLTYLGGFAGGWRSSKEKNPLL